MASRFFLFLVMLYPGLMVAEITALDPSGATVGTAAFTLRAYGEEFVPEEQLAFNGRPLATTFVSRNELRAVVPAELIRVAGRFDVTLIGYNSLPFSVNTPPLITSTSPLPAAALGSTYATTLTFSGGTAPVRWSLIAGSLPLGLSLNPELGIVVGTAAAVGTSTFSVRLEDFSRVATTKTLRLQVGTSPTGPPSCVISPQNQMLPLHRPEFHTGGPIQFPDHEVRVNVSNTGAGVSITIVANQIVFPNRTGLAVGSTLSGITNGSGTVAFPINPPAGAGFERTDLVATGRSGSTEFRCEGTVVVGAGTMTSVRRSATTILGEMRQRFGLDYDRFSVELLRLANSNPRLEQRATKLFDRFEPILQEAMRGGRPKITWRDFHELDLTVKELEREGSPELRRGIARWREDLLNLGVRAKVSPSKVEKSQLAAIDHKPVAGAKLSFEPNLGQQKSEVKFVSRGAGHTALFTDRGMTLMTPAASEIGMRLIGRQGLPKAEPVEVLASRSHYMIGDDPAQWQRNVPNYGRLRYNEVYPGTDLLFYGDEGRLRYDFVLRPGARPSRIQLGLDGVNDVELLQSGDLILHHVGGVTRLGKPLVYQTRNGERVEIASRFAVRGKNRIGFEIGQYDRGSELVIDPVLTYSTFAGGSREEAGLAVAVDAQGSTYVAGVSGGNDAFVTKFSPDGTSVVYTAVFGGSGVDVASSVAVDAAGNAYVAGSTRSANFPIVGGVQSSFGGNRVEVGGDGFVVKFNPNGTSMLYSTYLGGSDGDVVKAMAIDLQGNAYLAGYTASANFPVRGAIQPTLRGGVVAGMDAFAAKLNPAGNALIYSTFLGGSGDDLGMSIAVDGEGNAHIAGVSYSTNFPLRNAMQNSSAGSGDAFLAKINPAGDSLIYSTYFGGDADDFGLGLALDRSGNAYLAGTTGSRNFPVLNAVQAVPGSTAGLGFDGFVAKFNPNGNTLLYSTYFGGSGIDMIEGITVGEDGAAYVVGETDSADFPAKDAVRAGGALSDGFLAKLAPSGLTVEYASFLGGQGMDAAGAVAVDRSGHAYVAGTSASRDFPVTFGASQSLMGGRLDAFVLKIGTGVSRPQVSLLSAAGLERGGGVAPDSLVSLFGASLAPRIEVASSATLPVSLAGVSVSVKDSRGVSRNAPLIFVAPSQINFVLPADVAVGLGEASVVSGSQTVASGVFRVERVAPALFAANANGSGAPAALAIRVAGGTQVPQVLFTCGTSAGSCVPAPVDLSVAGEEVYLTLFGTGIRGRASLAGVALTIGGLPVPVGYAGAQGEFAGFDQVNAGPLPAGLVGKGNVDLVLSVDGVRANVLTVNIR